MILPPFSLCCYVKQASLLSLFVSLFLSLSICLSLLHTHTHTHTHTHPNQNLALDQIPKLGLQILMCSLAQGTLGPFAQVNQDSYYQDTVVMVLPLASCHSSCLRTTFFSGMQR